jgi:hypothetical protein
VGQDSIPAEQAHITVERELPIPAAAAAAVLIVTTLAVMGVRE